MSDADTLYPRERIQYWDTLRGIAVLGVLMANMPFMSLTRSLSFDHVDLSHGPGDTFAFWVVRIFADTKFITIFSLLFGAGLALMSEKAVARGAPFKRVYFRRIVTLGVIGLLHGWYVWFGDILFHYALMGSIAVWFRNRSPKFLFALGGVIILLTALISIGLSFIDLAEFADVPEGETPEAQAAARREAIHDHFSSGSFSAATEERQKIWFVMQPFFLVLMGPRTLGLFLVGMALVRSGVLIRIDESRKIAMRAILIGLPVGALLTLVKAFTFKVDETGARAAGAAAAYFVALFLSPAYMGMVALWTLSDRLHRLQERFAAVGRMGFTNYLSHSIITCGIFCFGRQWDQWDRLEGLLLTLAIYVFQLWFSPWWLDRFRFGPMEWLWRSATYWKLQPMRRTSGA